MTVLEETNRSSPVSATSAAILDVRSVSVSYPGKHGQTWALKNVTLCVRPAEAVGLIGESGSGKTTLARCMLGLIRPTSGQVAHRGRNIYAIRNTARFRMLSRDASTVFQDPRSSLNPRLSVAAVVRDPLTVLHIGTRRERDAKVIDALQSVGLPASIAGRPVRALSGGQLQRVALARALAVDPSLIIADEPTSALDVSVQAQVLNVIRDIRAQRQLAVLVVSHDMRVVRCLTNRTIVMYRGEIVEQGHTEQVYEDPQHPYTKSLLAAAPRLASVMASTVPANEAASGTIAPTFAGQA
ncbi:ABC transporter ATP-binding protein [Phytoactinopolyspora limicola]|uniref:ABC transporter ATP-binding protein n=1 Tax=Phytoactinopolyspora limicola TaxID=2715536 RepID=UPI001409A852